MKKILRLGTRGSPLALVQAETARAKLLGSGPVDADIEIVPIRTSGDWRPGQKNQTFLETGGDKGLYTKEIEEALLSGVIDMAVHSMKDVPSRLPDGLEIPFLLERGDPRDVFIGKEKATLETLPAGAVIGTASLRRQAQILARRPDLRVVPLRGNVGTRLEKLAKGEADATVLALAGLQRLGLQNHVSSILEPEIMLPSAGQGAIGIEIRRDDQNIRDILKPIHCASTASCIEAERAFLLALDGSCSTPVGALARLKEGGGLTLDVLMARPDGSEIIRMSRSGSAEDAAAIGKKLGEDAKRRLPPDFFTVPK
jgi:hydroxymethylbilane synthase